MTNDEEHKIACYKVRTHSLSDMDEICSYCGAQMK